MSSITRPFTQALHDRKGVALRGVEIGVYLGDNAYEMLNNLDIADLWLVDPYRKYPEYKGNFGWDNIDQRHFDDYHNRATVRLDPFPQAHFIREQSHLAASQIPDNLDFIYIDGNHNYEYVRRDLELYYPKVKAGGMFGGDNFDPIFPGVAKAVLELIEKKNLPLYGAHWKESFDWWVIKPDT